MSVEKCTFTFTFRAQLNEYRKRVLEIILKHLRNPIFVNNEQFEGIFSGTFATTIDRIETSSRTASNTSHIFAGQQKFHSAAAATGNVDSQVYYRQSNRQCISICD